MDTRSAASTSRATGAAIWLAIPIPTHTAPTSTSRAVLA